MTRGQRLRTLREALGATQKIIERLSRLSHAQVSKAESQDIGWNSHAVVGGLSEAYSMTPEQFLAYVDGRPTMLLEQAMAIARPKIEGAKEQASGEDQIDAIARNAVKIADVDDEFAPSTIELMRIVVRERGPKTPLAELAAEAATFARGVQSLLERGRTAHKSDLSVRARSR